MYAQDGHTPLFSAAGNGHLEVVHALVERNRNMNKAKKVCINVSCMVCKQV